MNKQADFLDEVKAFFAAGGDQLVGNADWAYNRPRGKQTNILILLRRDPKQAQKARDTRLKLRIAYGLSGKDLDKKKLEDWDKYLYSTHDFLDVAKKTDLQHMAITKDHKGAALAGRISALVLPWVIPGTGTYGLAAKGVRALPKALKAVPGGAKAAWGALRGATLKGTWQAVKGGVQGAASNAGSAVSNAGGYGNYLKQSMKNWIGNKNYLRTAGTLTGLQAVDSGTDALIAQSVNSDPTLTDALKAYYIAARQKAAKKLLFLGTNVGAGAKSFWGPGLKRSLASAGSRSIARTTPIKVGRTGRELLTMTAFPQAILPFSSADLRHEKYHQAIDDIRRNIEAYGYNPGIYSDNLQDYRQMVSQYANANRNNLKGFISGALYSPINAATGLGTDLTVAALMHKYPWLDYSTWVPDGYKEAEQFAVGI